MDFHFHLSLPCRHIGATEKFYTQIIGVAKGRQASNWIDINLFGNQITFIKAGSFKFDYPSYSFEKTVLPSFHFGVILPQNQWQELYHKLKAEDFLYLDDTPFLTQKTGAHQSFFIKDPSGYIIEFKCFEVEADVFSN